MRVMDNLMWIAGIALLAVSSWLYHSVYRVIRLVWPDRFKKWYAWFAVESFVWDAAVPAPVRRKYLWSLVLSQVGFVMMAGFSWLSSASITDMWWFGVLSAFALWQLVRGGLRHRALLQAAA
jgi:hypothetical protein